MCLLGLALLYLLDIKNKNGTIVPSRQMCKSANVNLTNFEVLMSLLGLALLYLLCIKNNQKNYLGVLDIRKSDENGKKVLLCLLITNGLSVNSIQYIVSIWSQLTKAKKK